jgi:undecaprenyl-diphosphatase
MSAVHIGISQALALLPGISRSGATISTALIFDMDVRTAGRFSFLLAIPAVIGAALLTMGEAGSLTDDVGLVPLLAGTLTSVVVGYFSLDLLFRILQKGKLYVFAPYCFIVGILTFLFF